ncbi:MAG: hypothetical protein ACPGF8_00995, partial [Opitutales bacterium]
MPSKIVEFSFVNKNVTIAFNSLKMGPKWRKHQLIGSRKGKKDLHRNKLFSAYPKGHLWKPPMCRDCRFAVMQ